MTEQNNLYNTLAPLGNVFAFLELAKRLQNRGHGLPGMGCFYGPSGYGKTMAGTYVANETQGVAVQVKSCWGAKQLCVAIARELGLKPARTTADIVDQISEVLAVRDVPLLIDEADFLVKKSMIEIVRDIYESTFAPVILIGEELLPQKLQKWERIHGRILGWTAAEPCDEDDFDLLRKLRCPDLQIEDQLLETMRTASRGSARRIVENLELGREIAARKGIRQLSLADWGDRAFFTGAVPAVRRFA